MSNNKLKIDREELVYRLKKAINFVPDKEIIPMFNNFFCQIQGGLMQIIAAGPARQIKLFCPCESKTDWAFCVPADLFISTLKLYRENVVTISEVNSKKIELRCGKSKANITLDCMPATFHVMTIEDIDSEIVMHQTMLAKALETTEGFIDPKHPNANLTVLNISEIRNKIIFTACKSQLFCRAAIRPISINAWKPVSIQVETIKAVLSVIDKGEIGIIHSDKKICFTISGDPSESVEIISTLYNGQFPNTEKYFDTCSNIGVTINTIELQDAVKRLKLYASDDNPIFSIDNLANAQELRLHAMDINTGREGEELISITNGDKVIMNKAYNIKFMLDILGVVDSGEVKICFDDSYTSFILPVVGTEEENIFNFLLAGVKKAEPIPTV